MCCHLIEKIHGLILEPDLMFGYPLQHMYSTSTPFEEVSDSYTYYIFAYDETSLIVRYIMCDSLENGADQPFYLSLDWQ